MTYLWPLGIIAQIFIGCGGDEWTQKPYSKVVQPTEVNIQFSNSNAIEYQINIEGCKSGYEAKLTAKTTSVNLYKRDQDCLAKLVGFTINGDRFKIITDQSFSTYAKGDKAIFSNSKKTKTGDKLYKLVQATVASQLSSPLSQKDKVSYNLHSLNHEPRIQEVLNLSYGIPGNAQPKGDKSLSFQLINGQLSGTGNQILRYRFRLGCLKPIEINPSSPEVQCDSWDYSEISYTLVAAESTKPCRGARTEGCASYFDGREATIDLDNHLIPLNDPLHANGGFITTKLNSPEITESREWHLIIKARSSFQYFPIRLHSRFHEK